MAKRRGNHEGSIYQRSDGSWRGQITLAGGRLSFAAKKRAEVVTWLKEIGTQADRGLTPNIAKTTFGNFLEEWLETAKARITFETWRSYNQLIRDYISPSLGAVTLRELTPIHIQRLYNHQIEQGVGKRTVQKTHAVIRASLNKAEKLGIIPNNPSNATDPPKPDSREMKFLSESEANHLLATAEELGDANFALFYVALVTGMRQGELLALHWPEVDFARGILHVKYSLKRVPGKGLESKKPKTKSSVRSITIGSDTSNVLKQQQERLHQIQKNLGTTWHELGYVFPAGDGLPMEPAVAYRSFQQLLKKAGLPKIRFHDLRHTAASLMLAHGVDVLVASKRLGHAKPSITLDFYGHILPHFQSEAAEVLERIFRSK